MSVDKALNNLQVCLLHLSNAIQSERKMRLKRTRIKQEKRDLQLLRFGEKLKDAFVELEHECV